MEEWKFVILAFFFGGLSYSLYPLCISQVCDRLDHSQIVKGTSLLLIVFGSGSVLGPIIASLFGADQLFTYFALLLSFLVTTGIYSILFREVVPQEEQTDFLPLPSSTPIMYEMDPPRG